MLQPKDASSTGAVTGDEREVKQQRRLFPSTSSEQPPRGFIQQGRSEIGRVAVRRLSLGVPATSDTRNKMNQRKILGFLIEIEILKFWLISYCFWFPLVLICISKQMWQNHRGEEGNSEILLVIFWCGAHSSHGIGIP
ncbi:hypothetical protein U1Q18_021119 [Sarracenia purpurea var. burkii]